MLARAAAKPVHQVATDRERAATELAHQVAATDRIRSTVYLHPLARPSSRARTPPSLRIRSPPTAVAPSSPTAADCLPPPTVPAELAHQVAADLIASRPSSRTRSPRALTLAAELARRPRSRRSQARHQVATDRDRAATELARQGAATDRIRSTVYLHLLARPSSRTELRRACAGRRRPPPHPARRPPPTACRHRPFRPCSRTCRSQSRAPAELAHPARPLTRAAECELAADVLRDAGMSPRRQARSTVFGSRRGRARTPPTADRAPAGLYLALRWLWIASTMTRVLLRPERVISLST